MRMLLAAPPKAGLEWFSFSARARKKRRWRSSQLLHFKATKGKMQAIFTSHHGQDRRGLGKSLTTPFKFYIVAAVPLWSKNNMTPPYAKRNRFPRGGDRR